MNTVVAVLLLFPLAQDKPRERIAVFDSGVSSTEPLKTGDVPESFKGDAIVSNGRISLVVPKNAGTVELRAGAATRAKLHLLGTGGQALGKLDRVALVEHGRGGATLEIAGKTAKGVASAKLCLRRGELSIEAVPGEGAEQLRVECPARFIVLPDFFADDIVIDARKFPSAAAEIPSENFVLQLAGKGEAIVMTVFENKEQDVRLSFSGSGDARVANASEIEFRKGRKIWVSVLEAPQIWHTTEIQAADAGRILPLDWKMPFLAAWRCDLMRSNELADSWEMLLQKEKDGDFIKPGWAGGGDSAIPAERRRWTAVLGTFQYPVWSDPERNGFIQPITHDKVSFRGPAVIYPVNRIGSTPLDTFTVVDVVRSTLGAGPCEYLLDLEGNRSENKGRATCSARDTLNRIYGAGEQKTKRDEVEKVLQDDLVFVKHIRGRIARYVDFGREMREYLREQKKVHPELMDAIGELEKIVEEIDARFAEREEKIKTPDHVAKMNDDFRRDVLNYEGPDAMGRMMKYVRELLEIGDNQDELAGECRWAVKALRQKAGLLMAADPRMAPITGELRAKTQEALRNPAGPKGSRR